MSRPEPLTDVVLQAEDLSRNFGAVMACDAVNVSVTEGEVVGIIGANGAGKTTFVNLVTGYLKPTGGRIHFLGRDITSFSPREITRLGVCRSFQIPQLFPELPVLENLLIALGIARTHERGLLRALRSPDMVDATADILARYGIADYADHKAAVLPQGVRKLLDIAMATVGEPRLALLDEPTSGVSVDEKHAVMDTLVAALKEQRVTVLFVEHDMEIVARYAQRAVAFYEGRIIADDSADHVLAHPAVRQYIIGPEFKAPGAIPC